MVLPSFGTFALAATEESEPVPSFFYRVSADGWLLRTLIEITRVGIGWWCYRVCTLRTQSYRVLELWLLLQLKNQSQYLVLPSFHSQYLV